jgi:uncharacterized radical SAM superfamily Fe-S cluster-containing enzyme
MDGSTGAATSRRERGAQGRALSVQGQTTSLCETCLALVPAKIISEATTSSISSAAAKHGVQKTLISDDLGYWKAQKDWLKPGDRPLGVHTRTEHGCPLRLRPLPRPRAASPAWRSSRSTRPATSPARSVRRRSVKREAHRPLAEIEQMLDVLVASEGEPDLVQISGGEPTIHPQFWRSSTPPAPARCAT